MRLNGLAYYARSIPNLLWNVLPRIKVLALFAGQKLHEPLTIRLRGSGLQFRVRTALDVWVIKETCLDRDYEQAVRLQDGWTIIDIGAGLGDFTAYAAQRSPQGRVLAYEPFPESFALLQQNLKLNDLHNVEAQPYAIAAQAGPLALHVGLAEAVQHSTTQMGAKTIEVQAISLAQAFDDHQVVECDFLKMDIEGGEYAILRAIEPKVLKRVQRLALEYHDNTPAGYHTELVALLHAQGFQVQVRPNPVYDYLGYLYAVRN
jgi:FkbM family methyltransferase